LGDTFIYFKFLLIKINKRYDRFPDFSGANEKSPNSFAYNDSYDGSPVTASATHTQGLALNGDYPLHGLSLDQVSML
jgi:hypothetical protein